LDQAHVRTRRLVGTLLITPVHSPSLPVDAMGRYSVPASCGASPSSSVTSSPKAHPKVLFQHLGTSPEWKRNVSTQRQHSTRSTISNEWAQPDSTKSTMYQRIASPPPGTRLMCGPPESRGHHGSFSLRTLKCSNNHEKHLTGGEQHVKIAQNTGKLESAQPDSMHSMLCQLVPARSPVVRLSSGPESLDRCLSSNTCEIPKTHNFHTNPSRSPDRGTEHVKVREFAWASQDASLCEQFHESYRQLKDALKEETNTCEARLEIKVHAALSEFKGRTQLLSDIWQANFESRLCALELGKQDYAKTTADFETRLSALEKGVGSLPDLGQLHQHARDLDMEVSTPRTDMEKKMYHLEEQVGQLQDALHQRQIAHQESVTNVAALFEDKVGVLITLISSMTCTHMQQNIGQHRPEQEQQMVNSKITLESRLCKVEGTIDLIASILRTVEMKLAEVLQEVPVSNTANGSNCGLHETTAKSLSRVSSQQPSGPSDASLLSVVEALTHATMRQTNANVEAEDNFTEAQLGSLIEQKLMSALNLC